MDLQATEQGSQPPAAAAADPDHLQQPVAAPPSSPTGRTGCPKRSAVAGIAFHDDPVEEILWRLPVKPLFRFKCVSKTWFRLITECFRKRRFPQTLQGFFWGDERDGNYGHFIDLSGGSLPPVDPSFSFLTELPEIEKIVLVHSCNGLVLFRRRRHVSANAAEIQGYIVCNPATKEWVAVPSSGWTPAKGQEVYDPEYLGGAITYLFFDPAVSSLFKLVQFCHDSDMNMFQMHIYSSESGVWSERAIARSHEGIGYKVGSAFVNGMLHLEVFCLHKQQGMIVAVDGEGQKCRVIYWPHEERGCLVFLGQSQGNLYCMSGHFLDQQSGIIAELLIWALEDYGTEQWILKDSVSCLQLFGEVNVRLCFPSSPIAIHPDRNVFFFAYPANRKLVSYDMDSKKVSALSTLEDCWDSITPYFPYFAESSALAKKH